MFLCGTTRHSNVANGNPSVGHGRTVCHGQLQTYLTVLGG